MFGFLALGFFASIAFGWSAGLGTAGLLSKLGGAFGIETDKSKKEKVDKLKELHDLLRKKPEDLSPKDKKRLEQLGNDPDIDLDDDLSDKERANFEKITGTAVSDVEKEEEPKDKKEKEELAKNKALALLQMQVEEKEDDTSTEANELREAYEGFIRCAYDEEGNPRSKDDFDKEMNKLKEANPDLYKKIGDNIKNASNDEKAIKELNEKAANVTQEQAAAAVEKAKAKRAEIAKADELAALDEKCKKEMEGKTDDEKADIKKRYDDEKKAASDKWDAKIKQHIEAAAKADSGESLRQKSKAAKQAEKVKSDLEAQKAELDGEGIPKKIAEEYNNFKFDGIDPGAVDDENHADHKKALEQLKAAGLDPELYGKIAKAKAGKDKDGNEPSIDDIIKDKEISDAISKDIENRKKVIDEKIKAQQNVIDDYNIAKSKTEETNKPKDTPKQDPPKETKPEPVEADGKKYLKDEDGKFYEVKDDGTIDKDKPAPDDKIEDLEKSWKEKNGKKEPTKQDPPQDEEVTADDFEDGYSIKSKDGTEYIKHDGKFYMKTKDGDETEVEKFDDWLKEVENNTEFDPEDVKDMEDEAEGEEDKKKQNPHKIWKQKSYKRGNKTFKTKSYYNKKGASISKEEFQEKVKNYEKNNKKTAKESISDFLQDRLVLERFYPQDITLSKQFEGLDLAAFIKSRIEAED